MKWNSSSIVAAMVAWFSVALAAGSSNLADDLQQAADLDPQKLESLTADLAKLAPEHEVFEHAVGKWKTQIKSYFPDPENPELSKGSAEFKLLMGGRYLQQRFTGKIGGEKFEGLGINGYDTAQKKYVGVWIDSMGTGIMHSEGTYDGATHTMTEFGESHSPLGKVRMKMVSKPIDENQFLFTMHMLTPGGGETKMMEITYTSIKSDDQ